MVLCIFYFLLLISIFKKSSRTYGCETRAFSPALKDCFVHVWLYSVSPQGYIGH